MPVLKDGWVGVVQIDLHESTIDVKSIVGQGTTHQYIQSYFWGTFLFQILKKANFNGKFPEQIINTLFNKVLTASKEHATSGGFNI